METQLLLSLGAGAFISGAAAYLGSFMLSKRMALVAGPLGHLTLPGIALALVYGFNLSLGAAPFVFLGILTIWALELRTKLPMEALTAVVFASGVAIAFLFLPIEEAEAALVGDISKISLSEAIISMGICLGVALVIKIIYPKMVLINISEDLAHAQNINVKNYNLIYLVLIAIMVALGVKVVGALLTAALVAIPAAASRNMSRTLSQYTSRSILLGVLSSIGGIFLFSLSDLPPGPLIILVSTLLFLLSLFFKR